MKGALKDGNVRYFGEDVTNYRYDDAGRMIGPDSESAWRAGVNDAAPGIIMPGTSEVGVCLYQEHAPADEAMDYAGLLALDLEVIGPAGTFINVIKTFEASTSDPGLCEYKYWAAGFGISVPMKNCPRRETTRQS